MYLYNKIETMKAELKQQLTIHFSNKEEEKEAIRLSDMYEKQGFEQIKYSSKVGTGEGYILLEHTETFVHEI